MTTRGTMKTRIADEIGQRDDLSSQIENAINDAVTAYQIDRFWFNESRGITFSTVAGREFYTSSDNANIPNLLDIDFISIVVGTTDVRFLKQYPEKIIEDLSNNGTQSGEPYNYSYYNEQLRLYPVPNSVLTIRIAGHVKIDAPANDGAANNRWMIDAERLIRSRAKYQLALHVLNNPDLAAAMSPNVPAPGSIAGHEAYWAWKELKDRTGSQYGTGFVQPHGYC